VEGVLALLKSPQFVVKFEAALTLSNFAHQEVIKPILRPIITEVMKGTGPLPPNLALDDNQQSTELFGGFFLVYFELVDTIDNEDLIGALQVMIVNYQEEMAPFAVELLTRFVRARALNKPRAANSN